MRDTPHEHEESMKGKLASGKAKSKIENCCPPAPAPGAREAKAKGRFKAVIKNQPQALPLGGRGGSWVRAPYVALNVKHKQGVTLYLKRIRYHAGGGEAARAAHSGTYTQRKGEMAKAHAARARNPRCGGARCNATRSKRWTGNCAYKKMAYARRRRRTYKYEWRMREDGTLTGK